ncbi:MAG: type I restriction endonuclease [Pseudomonadota bacterium]|nr:type I restriction endonuclease [Pseudomonadota bacterium]
MSIDRIKEKLHAIQARIPMVRGRGEEATKQALVLPMLDALGYDIWNPTEVCPEFEADFAIKKLGQKEKVDLAIVVEGTPRAFIEVKPVDCSLDGHNGQLARYFNGVPSVSLAVLTNGTEYRFFTDTGEPNLLDPTPFFTLRLDGVDLGLDVLARFHKSVFSPGAIREYATELNYTAKMTSFLRQELDLRSREPSDALVRWILAGEGMYEGRVMASVLERYRPIAKNALQIVLRDVVRRSVAALDEGVSAPTRAEVDLGVPAGAPAAPAPAPRAIVPAPASAEAGAPDTGEPSANRGIVTTQGELSAFAILRDQFGQSAIGAARVFDSAVRKDVPIEVAYKDTTVYFGVYFNKPSWWFVRLQLDCKQPWVAFNVEPAMAPSLLPAGFSLLPATSFGEVRVGIRGPDDLHALNRIAYAAMCRTLEERKRGSEPPTSEPSKSN